MLNLVCLFFLSNNVIHNQSLSAFRSCGYEFMSSFFNYNIEDKFSMCLFGLDLKNLTIVTLGIFLEKDTFIILTLCAYLLFKYKHSNTTSLLLFTTITYTKSYKDQIWYTILYGYICRPVHYWLMKNKVYDKKSEWVELAVKV